MKAVLIKGSKADKAEDLYIGGFDEPLPGDGELQVEVKAFGLNRMDILQRKGSYPMPPMANTPQSKEILGVEFSGIVRKIGSAAKEGYREGDAVFGLVYGGAMAQYVVVKEGMVVRKPKELSWEQCAAIPENWMTAWQAMSWIGGLQKGQNFLFHAGASGVGTAAIQLARHIGAKHVFASAGSEEKIKFLKELGCTDAINYKTDGDQDKWVETVKKGSDGEGVHVIVDPVGRSYFNGNVQALARDGRLVLLGFMSGSKVETDIGPLLYKRLRVEGTTLRSRSPEYQAKLLHELTEVAMPKQKDGFDLVIHKVFKASEIVQATLEMEQGKNTGKIICVADWQR